MTSKTTVFTTQVEHLMSAIQEAGVLILLGFSLQSASSRTVSLMFHRILRQGERTWKCPKGTTWVTVPGSHHPVVWNEWLGSLEVLHGMTFFKTSGNSFHHKATPCLCSCLIIWQSNRSNLAEGDDCDDSKALLSLSTAATHSFPSSLSACVSLAGRNGPRSPSALKALPCRWTLETTEWSWMLSSSPSLYKLASESVSSAWYSAGPEKKYIKAQCLCPANRV